MNNEQEGKIYRSNIPILSIEHDNSATATSIHRPFSSFILPTAPKPSQRHSQIMYQHLPAIKNLT